MPMIKDSTLKIRNTLEINYRLYGKKNPLVLIHGNSQSLESFTQLMKILEQKEKSYLAIDIPGHGKSSNLTHYSLIELAKAIAYTIDTLILDDQYQVFGHSLGGHLAVHSLNYLKVRPSKIFLLGSPHVSIPFNPQIFKDTAGVEFFSTARPSLKLFYQNSEIQTSNTETQQLIRKFAYQTDGNARQEIFSSISEGKYYDEAEILKMFDDVEVTRMVYEDDKIINQKYMKEQSNKIFFVPGEHSDLIHNPNPIFNILYE